MPGRFKKITLLAGLALVFASLIQAAPTQIGRLGLTRQDNFTVLTIEGDGQIRYAHQSVEAKEGKPFRIVIDCLASRHNLPQLNYSEIPSCAITTIRTSQYAVAPEEVVRIVLDLRGESVYRVEDGPNVLKVYIADATSVPNLSWSTPRAKGFTPRETPETKTVQPVITASRPQPIPQMVKTPTTPVMSVAGDSKNKDINPPSTKPQPLQEKLGLTLVQQSSVENKKTDAGQVTSAPKPVPNVVQLQTKTEKSPSQPVTQSNTEKERMPATTPKTNPDLAQNTINRALAFANVNEPPAQPPTPGDAPRPSGIKSEDTHMSKPESAGREKNQTAQTGNQPTPNAPSGNTDVLASIENTKKESAPVLPVLDQVKEENEPAGQPDKVASPDKGAQPVQKTEASTEVKKEETPAGNASRFRRETAKSARLKQTEVVQFPQRMVITYKGNQDRDPFATLIDFGKRAPGVGISSIPNIETLKLVGILEVAPGGGKDAALLEDHDGIGYILKPGDRVRDGYVAQIDEFAIYFHVDEYGWSRTVVKELEKEK